jgi:hypothetical protein
MNVGTVYTRPTGAKGGEGASNSNISGCQAQMWTRYITVDKPVIIKGVHVYNNTSGVTASAKAYLWDAGSTLKAKSTNFTSIPGLSWVYIPFDTPIELPASTTWAIGMYMDKGGTNEIRTAVETTSADFSYVIDGITWSYVSYSRYYNVCDTEAAPNSTHTSSEIVVGVEYDLAPTAPTNLSPSGSSMTPAVINTVTPRLSWKHNDPEAAAQSAYQVLIYNSGGALIHDTGKVASANQFYDVPSAVLSFDGTYYWRVRSWDAANQASPYSADAYIHTNRSPNAPASPSPTGTSTSPGVVNTLTPRYSWTFSDSDPSDTQSAFQVLVYDAAGALKHDSGKVASTNKYYDQPATILAWGAKYYWKVRTWDNHDYVGVYTGDNWILTNQGPTATYTSPTGGSTTPTIYHDTVQPTFSWTYSDPESNTQAAVQIQILDGATLVWDSGEIATTGSTYQIPATANLVYDKTYNTKIRAKDSVGSFGAYSALTYFQLNRTPNAPTNLSPAGTSVSPAIITDNLVPRLSWAFSDADASDTQSAFQVIIYDGSGAVVKDTAKVASANQFYDVPAGVLLSGKTYHWKVANWDNHDKSGPFAADQYFHTNATPGTPTNQSPAGGSSTSPALIKDDLTPQFTWTHSDTDGDAQKAFQFRIYNDLGTLLHDTGELVTSNQFYELPVANKLSYNLLYQWEVRTKDVYDAWSAYTARGWIKPYVAPPQSVTATADDLSAKIIIDWADSAAEGLEGYNVYRSTVTGGPYTLINDTLITVSNYSDSQVSTGVTYYYVVKAYASSLVSDNSAEASATATFSAWFIGDFKFSGPSKLTMKRPRSQSQRVVLGKVKKVIQDRGFLGDELSLELFLVDDQSSTGKTKRDSLVTELKKLQPLAIRDPFGRTWKAVPGDYDETQLATGKLEYLVKIPLIEVN